MNDLRFAFRQLLKAPAFTAMAVITLTIGIGANTAIFSLINEFFLRGLPFKETNRLVVLTADAKERNLSDLPMSVPRFWHFRDGQTVFSQFAAESGNGYVLTGMGDPVQLLGADVTANYFETLGVRALQGRLFRPEEEMKADVAVISASFWRSRLNSDPNAIGRNLTLNGVPTTVIGIVPDMPVIWAGRDADVWTLKPFAPPGLEPDRLMRGVSFMRVVGRMKPGVTIEQVNAALVSLQQGYKAAWPDNADNSWQPSAISISENTTGELRIALTILLCAVGAVLLIACSNVANLLLVRFTGRRREIALRMALGASRRGLVRLFVVESTLVSVISGICGLCLALWIVYLIPRLSIDGLPFDKTIELDPLVLVFTLGLSLATGFVMGLYPAWQSSRAELVEGLKDGGRSISGSAGQQRFRRGLVATQVGFSVVLLAGAGLLITSFIQLSKQEAGFVTTNLWVGFIGTPQAGYPDAEARVRFTDRLLSELRTTPGFQDASVTDSIPLSGGSSRSPYARVDGNPPPLNQRPLGLMRSISPGYLRTYSIPLLAGRDFDERDGLNRPLVVLVSKSTATKLFPGEDPIGREIFFGTDNNTGLRVQVIGIVGDTRSVQLQQQDEIEFYRPWAQRSFPFFGLTVKSSLAPDATAAAVRTVMKKLDSGLPILQPNTLDAILAQSLAQRRLTMTLLAAFAGIALLLAAVGIYAAVAYTVEQRTGEIGVRMALGAQTRDVLHLVVGQGMRPVLLGLLFGLGASLAMGKLLGTQLYKVSAFNPSLLAAAAFLLGGVALLACLFPARRAMMVSPMQALRAD